MRKFIKTRTLLILYFMAEMIGSLFLIYLGYMMFGLFGVIAVGICSIYICHKVDKMMKGR